jgi:acyl-CoA thioester hydrolase
MFGLVQDNDMYGHVNNTEYYSYFDTVINHFLITQAGLDPVQSKSIGLCVESKCNFFAPLEFPAVIEAGLFISHRGSSSIRYEVGIFEKGEEVAAAHGHFVHVFVDEATRKPMPFSKDISDATDLLLVTNTDK